MSRTVRQALGAGLLLALFTLLVLGSIGTDEAGHDRALQALDRFTRTEAALRQDILLVRAGLLRNYDPLVAKVDSIATNLNVLQAEVRAGDSTPDRCRRCGTSPRDRLI